MHIMRIKCFPPEFILDESDLILLIIPIHFTVSENCRQGDTPSTEPCY